ncbi:uncharacterized protein CLUP02_10442 [Colletotrichum lupini]|uniref:Uncharacterized protein n=1 Tax=Colletotrichum lupini TaxID=145971 RepID=A0A9Q8SWQ4_9PEZI|nr:uncharacterized protein CLUP02_10442 [Colletotrichum lupini]UQC84946.1 hypothetical protein CLUP02_10442 [Colletotrichum lupini]
MVYLAIRTQRMLLPADERSWGDSYGAVGILRHQHWFTNYGKNVSGKNVCPVRNTWAENRWPLGTDTGAVSPVSAKSSRHVTQEAHPPTASSHVDGEQPLLKDTQQDDSDIGRGDGTGGVESQRRAELELDYSSWESAGIWLVPQIAEPSRSAACMRYREPWRHSLSLSLENGRRDTCLIRAITVDSACISALVRKCTNIYLVPPLQGTLYGYRKGFKERIQIPRSGGGLHQRQTQPVVEHPSAPPSNPLPSAVLPRPGSWPNPARSNRTSLMIDGPCFPASCGLLPLSLSPFRPKPQPKASFLLALLNSFSLHTLAPNKLSLSNNTKHLTKGPQRPTGHAYPLAPPTFDISIVDYTLHVHLVMLCETPLAFARRAGIPKPLRTITQPP